MFNSDNTSYDAAVSALYSLAHQARTKEALERSAKRRTLTIQDMREYMRRIDLVLPQDVAIIHITGTKGKGSTACFCESILRRRYGLRTGMFTSPHLVDIRERIRINGKPVSKSVFAKAYFCIRQRLEIFPQHDDADLPQLPGYFRMLTLMGIYIFSKYEPNIDVILLEVGMGGRYDATNLFDLDRRNVVCGVTLLDLDHTRVLGTEIEQIAWEKGGIFQVHKDSENVSKRPGRNEVIGSVQTNDDAMHFTVTKRFFSIGTNKASSLCVLYECAKIEGMGQKLNIVHEGTVIDPSWKLGLEGKHQRINAELAHSLCESVVQQMSISIEDKGMAGLQGALLDASWPGRCQTVSSAIPTKSVGSIQFNIRCDGAHTGKSIESGLTWFQSVSSCDSEYVMLRVLIFNCGHERNPVPLLQFIHSRRQNNANMPLFDEVYFCRSDSERPSMVVKSEARDLLTEAGLSPEKVSIGDDIDDSSPTWQDTLLNIWNHLADTDTSNKMHSRTTANLTVKEAIENIKANAERTAPQWSGKHSTNEFMDRARLEVCVTGSLYLVGSALDAVGWTENSAEGCLRT